MANKKDQENEAFPQPTDAAVIAAREEGVRDAIKESTKDAFKAGVNEGGYGGEVDPDAPPQIDHEVFQLQPLLDLDVDGLEATLKGDRAHPQVSLGKIVGLLECERSGKNRTEHVQMMCRLLGIKSPYEVTDAGPNYTNDTSRVALK